MTDRVIDISAQGAFLKIENKCLLIQLKDGAKTSIPIDEVGVLLLSNRAITLTHPVLSKLSSAGTMVVVTDDKHLPSAMMLPLQHHNIQTERMITQSQAALPLKKRLWQQVITQKIKNQAEFLRSLKGDDFGLEILSDQVKSGDTDNVEARAAVIYWRELGTISKRKRDADDANRFFNYGYAVLNAACARALCASGLHASIGLHHHNKYNSFCLSSDMMEPFRPLVDRKVVEVVNEYGSKEEINSAIRQVLISSILDKVKLNGEDVTAFYALTKMSQSLVNCFYGKTKKLIFPEKLFLEEFNIASKN